MFQYAAGRHLSLRHASELALDITPLLDPWHRPGYVPRNLDLDIFDIPLKLSCESRLARRIPLPRVYQRTTEMKAVLEEAVGVGDYYKEQSLRYDGRFLETKKNAYLQGYFQSEKYFQPIADTIRRDFRLDGPPGAVATLGRRVADSPSVCVNVRRADFVTLPQSGHGFVGLEYYRRAISVIQEQAKDAEYFVFSDDLAWCANELMPLMPRPATLVGHEYAGSKFSQYLWLMCQCQFFVIPNSSFAWWAAWLSQRHGKVVVAPKQWFSVERGDTSDIIPSNWVCI
jgi:hypothetical protein